MTSIITDTSCFYWSCAITCYSSTSIPTMETLAGDKQCTMGPDITNDL